MAMSIANRIPSTRVARLRGLVLVPFFLTLLFLAVPWPVGHKAHLLLHGLCAQNPDHTYSFGGQLLPFDARMTGIYTGYLVTTLVLFANGASRSCRPPSRSRLLLMVAFGGAVAVDGLNSMLADFGNPHFYEPRNWLRLVTGASAGIVLGIALCFLTASSVWRVVDTRRQTLENLQLLPIIALGWIPFALAVLSGWSLLFVPVTLVLIFAAALALSNLALVLLVMLRRRDFSFADTASLGGYGVAAIVVAVVAMAFLSIGRTLLEHALGTPSVT